MQPKNIIPARPKSRSPCFSIDEDDNDNEDIDLCDKLEKDDPPLLKRKAKAKKKKKTVIPTRLSKDDYSSIQTESWTNCWLILAFLITCPLSMSSMKSGKYLFSEPELRLVTKHMFHPW